MCFSFFFSTVLHGLVIFLKKRWGCQLEHFGVENWNELATCRTHAAKRVMLLSRARDRSANAIRNSLARKISRSQRTSETKHSFLTFLICEIHSVSYKFSYKGLPFSKVGPPDLRLYLSVKWKLISKECWHSLNFGAVSESIVLKHFLDQTNFNFNRKTFKKTRYERNLFNVIMLTAEGRKTSRECV